MRLSLRFVLPLLLVLAAIAYAVAPMIDHLMQRWFIRDLDTRSVLIANAIQDPLIEQLASGRKAKTREFFNRISQDERLHSVGYCATPEAAILASRTMPKQITCVDLARWATPGQQLLDGVQGPLHITVHTIPNPAPADTTAAPGQLVLVHDMSFISQRSEETKLYLFYVFLALAAAVSLITVIVAQLSWRGWMAGMQALLRGEGLLRRPEINAPPSLPGFKPIARDLQRLINDMESENRARDESQLTWSPETLRTILHGELRGEDVIVVSNREPYIHQRRAGHIEVQQPASGLVTALEPIMRACSGTWSSLL
jgi:trehalose 6-phosphate synthase